MKASDVKHSKFLSKVLRHKPGIIGIQLNQNGWVDVEKLLYACQQHGVSIDRPTLEQIVNTNEKRCFSFSEDGQKIRANQGHSIPVDLNLKSITPPDRLYYGTASCASFRRSCLTTKKIGKYITSGKEAKYTVRFAKSY